VRLDSGVYNGWTVPFDYDPLLAKLAAWAPSRDATIERMKRALGEYTIAGIRTNLAFFGEIMDDVEFRAGRLSTAFLDEFFARRSVHKPALEMEAVAALAAVFTQRRPAPASSTEPASRWLETGREALLR
jgi:acetyl-CoA carboxylase biotin carboxylase subunit